MTYESTENTSISIYNAPCYVTKALRNIELKNRKTSHIGIGRSYKILKKIKMYHVLTAEHYFISKFEF